jgi:hypothetical protein
MRIEWRVRSGKKWKKAKSTNGSFSRNELHSSAHSPPERTDSSSSQPAKRKERKKRAKRRVTREIKCGAVI